MIWWFFFDELIYRNDIEDFSKKKRKDKRHVSLTWALSFVKQVWRINGKKPNYLDRLNKEKEKKKNQMIAAS